MRLLKLLLLSLGILLALPIGGKAAQEVSRAQELESQREKKAATPSKEPRARLESALLWLQERKLQEKLETPGAGFKGIRPKLGGMSTGSGFGFGLQYDRVRMLDEQLDFSLMAAASRISYQLYQVKLDAPRLANGRAFVSLTGRSRSMPQEDFFGLGPESVKDNRTNYLYEDVSVDLRGGARPKRWARLGGGVEWLRLNVGHGTDLRFSSTEQVFTDATAPGIEQQPDFLKYNVSAALDTRDSEGNPHSGSYAGIVHTIYDDRSSDAFNFRRTEVELQQYVPFNAGHRVIAARFGVSLDDPQAGNRVPFYLQKSLGGSNDIRGFREFRFRDLNQMVMNLEYRWEAWIGLDMALFADAGKVFADRKDFDFNKLEKSYGLGFRFNTAKSVFWRIDIARSREGIRTFMKFEHVF